MTGKPVTILPMRLQVGDRFTDEEGEWEVTHGPFTTRQGKLVHATVQKPGEPATAREKTWGAHERLMIQRETAAAMPKAKRSASKPAKRR